MGSASGRGPLCFFLQGGDGDINPYYATTRLGDDAVGKRNWTGEQLGAEAARVANPFTRHLPQRPAYSLLRTP